MHNEKFTAWNLRFNLIKGIAMSCLCLGWSKEESYIGRILVKNFLESGHLNEQREDEVDE
jgi:hypothetical protein